ncbi:MAG: response regulator transcription factor [Flavobacteriia bacterium]|nr:response regulator transcription factor [Flavobacteriia bacterium]OIP46996.1 MAG: DNA-binding response regulator [Flavobacteriaceae bacterium CG2_30_31_66]PIV96589.1 MAG: DNA-binding response regulator [Flavobacteriaceae bacterium CG17_big_fil_post_rev_8_21_14_2_50_31_13]PIX13966.1 MAG: DNA-binding response regulator [Flavobacteriaceae bacterium CG_4_8_14_3_um_filter_31_8]PIY13875.1 MAG: DNA-binding response regulator [Flavobacteriaceae bacterium CG_4_10_14_3_um_filter_31_253]PIZ10576.1 MAG
MNLKVCIAEDNYFLLKAIKEKLSFFEDIAIKFTSNNGAELIGKLEENHLIDVILMDIQMPVMDGIKATELIKNKYPHIKIIMLTVSDDDEDVFKSIKAGANGYLLKEIEAENLYNCILEVVNGGAPMTPSIALKTLNLLRNPNFISCKSEEIDDVQLTKREIEILMQLSKGLNYNEISDNLIISPSTVRKHIENIYKKLQVHSKMEAVMLAQKRNLI